ncbi:site-specific tyrosine recombinase/integron integrase [Winogradskyella sp. A3E31]|uniref:site-specific tyrosine recombinase/integron integrase n=1 Tax=Winogradskyella sp. A3E31 TaxID=3349637 RepID=UPI00398AE022
MKNNTLPIVTLNRGRHRNDQQIFLSFIYNEELINRIRGNLPARWSTTLKKWYVKNTPYNLKAIYKVLGTHTTLDNQLNGERIIGKNTERENRKRQLNNNQKELLNGFYKYLKGKRYSENTVKVYTFFIADFIEFHNKKTVDALTNRDVELFIEAVFIKRNYSISTQRQFISALKLFVVFEPLTLIDSLELQRPKKDKKLPTVLSQVEVIELIRAAKNLKHRAIIALLYSSGLRISELLQLKISDIKIERRQIIVKNSKGRKDRYVTLADSFLPLLQNYLVSYKPTYYFIEGANGKTYSASSVRKFIYKYTKACGISVKVTPHTLRHSYATHLLEHGVGLRHIQELLGHSRPETTMIYTHVTRKDLLEIKSPLDNAIAQLQKTDKQEQKFLLSRK